MFESWLFGDSFIRQESGISKDVISDKDTGSTDARNVDAEPNMDSSSDLAGDMGNDVNMLIPCEDPNADRGDGTEAAPILVCDVPGFIAINDKPDLHYRLGDDLSFSEIYDKALVDLLEGNFDGGGFTMSGIKINGEAQLGLFGVIRGDVRNLTLRDVEIVAASERAGALASESLGTISNITLINVSVTGAKFVGGLVGTVQSSPLIERIRADVSVSGKYEFTGGLFGRASAEMYRNIEVTGDVVHLAITSEALSGIVEVNLLTYISTETLPVPMALAA